MATAVGGANVTVDQGSTTAWAWGDIIRSISRGGLTGLIVGVLACGIGVRLVMRLAALLVPEANGLLTENGNVVGVITSDGTLFLVLAGLLVGLLAGTIWVVVSPWIPGTGWRRAILTVPIAIGLGTAGLVDGSNPDFAALGHDPAVIVSLIGLVGIIGFLFAILDSGLDRVLPPADGPTRPVRPATAVYALLSVVGAVLIAPMVAIAYLTSKDLPTVLMGLLIGAIAIITVVSWSRQVRGLPPRPPRVLLAGRLSLAVAVAFGYVTIVPEVAQALGG
jgi:hypothetical protein